MNVNQQIYDYFASQRTQALNAFKSNSDVFKSVRAQLDLVNVDQVRQQFHEELITNCNQYWLEAIEPIHGVLFEYDYILRPDEEALAYGIMFEQMNDFRVQPEPYTFGYNYGFAALFEAVPGITLSALNPLSVLKNVTDVFNADGFVELRKAYLMTAFSALHLAVDDFVQTSSFKKLIRHSPIHFLIQEHDCPSQPVYVID